MKPPALTSFARRLRREWRLLDLPVEQHSVIVAVSGGADSSALLAALHELIKARKFALKVVAAHFNHHLRSAESDADAGFVEDLAEKFDFEFVCGDWRREFEISNLKENLEQAARRARYQFLIEIAEKFGAFAVLTAHTLNDQAETFLLRLIRGSSLDGLGAMKSISNLKSQISNLKSEISFFIEDGIFDSLKNSEISNLKSEISLIRPLLNWALREMTEDYCRERGIDFRVDAMNKDENFARVRVRRELLPLLATYNPQIVRQLSRTARLLGEDAEEINLAAKNLLDSALNNSEIDVKILKNYSAAMRRRVIRLWLQNQRGSLKRLEAKHFAAIDELLLKAEGGSFIELPAGGIVIKKTNCLIFEQRG